MVPAAVMMARAPAESDPALVPVPRVLIGAARTPVGTDVQTALIVDSARWTDQDVAPVASERETAPDWSDALAAASAEAEPRLSIASLAQEFKIPVRLATQIHAAATAEKIKPRTAFGLVNAESSFRTRAISPVGAVGLTQLLPSTARWLVPGTTRRDLMTPETNLRVGFRYLRHLLDQFDGNEKLALTAYNRGPGTVSKLLKRGRNPDNGYAEKVLTGRSARHVRLMNAKFGTRRAQAD